MTILAVVGDCATTTSVALAATWPSGDEVLVVEADRRGGSLAGWLDTPGSPSLTTVVASLGSSTAAPMTTIASMTQRSASGIRFLAGPLRSAPARRAIAEAATVVVPALARADALAIADVGADHHGCPFVRSAAAVLVVHRQPTASAGAAAVRLERLVESIEQLARADIAGAELVLAVVGDRPFDPLEIAEHIADAVPGAVAATVTLARDPLAADVIAGHAGVSSKRLRRLPLLRSASRVAARLAVAVDGHQTAGSGSGEGTRS